MVEHSALFRIDAGSSPAPITTISCGLFFSGNFLLPQKMFDYVKLMCFEQNIFSVVVGILALATLTTNYSEQCIKVFFNAVVCGNTSNSSFKTGVLYYWQKLS